MNHPNPESWMDYLYGELSRKSRREHEAHLTDCPTCRQQLQNWKSTLGALDTDGGRLGRSPDYRSRWNPTGALQWAAVLLLTLGIGFAVGNRGRVTQRELDQRLTAAHELWQQQFDVERQRDAVRVTRELSSAVREENRQLIADLSRQLVRVRAEDQVQLANQLRAYDQERALDYADLRNSLTVLARQTGTGFRQAESQFNWLASGLTTPVVLTTPGTNAFPEYLH